MSEYQNYNYENEYNKESDEHLFEEQGENEYLENEPIQPTLPNLSSKPPKPERVLRTEQTPVQLKNKMTKQQFKDMMMPNSSMNTPIKANNKQIIPTINNTADKIFQAKVHTVGNKGTLDLTDRFHSREDPHTYVNWSRRTQDLAPNSYRSEQINTMQHQMHKHKNQVIYGDNSKRYKTANQSFSDVGSQISGITTPKHPKHFSKDYQTTTEWQKDTCKLNETDFRPINGQFNSTTTKKPNQVTSWKGGTVNKQFIKDITKFSSLKLKYQ